MILTIGCSFTEGTELPDPSTQAWPYLLSDHLNIPVHNKGKGGSSNDYILRTAIEETSKTSYDIVVIQWSEPSRMEVWWEDIKDVVSVTAQSRYGRIGSFSWLKQYYATNHSDFNDHRKWAIQILALQGYFKSINQRYIMSSLSGFTRHGFYKEYWALLKHIWEKVDTTYFVGWPHECGITTWQGDCPLGPGGHPLELGHQRIADKFNEYIRNLGWVS